MRTIYSIVALILLAMGALANPAVRGAEVSLTGADGNPIRWGENRIPFGNPPKTGPQFHVETAANGWSLVGGLFRVRTVNGVLSSPDPQVRVEKNHITIDAALIDRSLRAAAGLAWAGGKLYVAERHSNDDADRYVYAIGPDNMLGERYETVHRPAAVAVSSKTMFVLGDDELAAFDLTDKRRLWSVATKFDKNFHQIAVLGDRIYVPDNETPVMRIFSATDGKPAGEFALLPTETAANSPKVRFFGPSVAAAPGGTLIVSNGSKLSEYGADGKWLRTLAEIPRMLSLAVSGKGEIAVAAQEDNGFFVLKMNPTGKPLLKIMRTGWNDFGKEICDRTYLAGLEGKVLAVGGLAFDDQDHLYVGDRNDAVAAGIEWRGMDKDMASDGGVVKLSAQGNVLARLASRFTDGSVVRQRIAERKQRPPLLRMSRFLERGGREAIVVYGDSISQVGGDWNGGASSTDRNWAMLLGTLLKQRHPNCVASISSQGIGGNTASNGLCRAPHPDRPDMNAALYLLQFGTNDIDREWTPPDRYAESLRQFVRALFVYTDSDVVLVTTGPIVGEHRRDPADYHQAMMKVAAEFGIPVVDVTKAVNDALGGRPYPTLHLGDEPGRKKEDPHPNDAGHQVWAEAALKVLESGAVSSR